MPLQSVTAATGQSLAHRRTGFLFLQEEKAWRLQFGTVMMFHAVWPITSSHKHILGISLEIINVFFLVEEQKSSQREQMSVSHGAVVESFSATCWKGRDRQQAVSWLDSCGPLGCRWRWLLKLWASALCDLHAAGTGGLQSKDSVNLTSFNFNPASLWVAFSLSE